MLGRDPEPLASPWDGEVEPNHDVDTITLLQEEIARLEAELRDRDQAALSHHDHHLDNANAHAHAHASDTSREQIDGLLAEIAARDETVELLLEQSRLYEEAASAQRAEWEQLHQWVEEVERRVEDRDAEGPRLRAELDAERDRGERLRVSSETERRGWDARRVGLERETQLLRDEIARNHQGSATRDESSLLELAAENRQLRTDCEALRTLANEAETLGRRFAEAVTDLETARREIRRLEDERQRERIEHEAELVALRSELARESLVRQAEPSSEPTRDFAPERPSAMDADERIRAFRQHLKELHDTEAAQRVNRSLGARLSRLWRNTGPG